MERRLPYLSPGLFSPIQQRHVEEAMREYFRSPKEDSGAAFVKMKALEDEFRAQGTPWDIEASMAGLSPDQRAIIVKTGADAREMITRMRDEIEVSEPVIAPP